MPWVGGTRRAGGRVLRGRPPRLAAALAAPARAPLPDVGERAAVSRFRLADWHLPLHLYARPENPIDASAPQVVETQATARLSATALPCH